MPDLVDVLVVPRSAVVREDGETLLVWTDAAPDEAFACELVHVVGDASAPALVGRVIGSAPDGDGSLVTALLEDASLARWPVAAGIVALDPTEVGLKAVRTRERSAHLAALRHHWEGRYATPGREPLTDPSPGFVDWLGAHPADRSLLLLGDGEGRNACAVPPAREVTVIELSPFAVERCRALADRPLDLICGDVYRWLASSRTRHPLVAALYLPQPGPSELSALVGYVARSLAAGGGCYLEGARFAFPGPVVEALTAALPLQVHEFTRGPDDIERIGLQTAR